MHELQTTPSHTESKRKLWGYLGLTILFFALSYLTLVFMHTYFAGGKLKFPPSILTAKNLTILGTLLVLYFLSDGLRLYCVIRALGSRISFFYILKLVFVNIFISNVTPMATGGGFIQVYFMTCKGISLGHATAATSLRTMLSALILFALAPIIIWIDPSQFSMFSTHHLLYLITIVSVGYLAIFWIILFKIQLVKQWLFWLLLLLKKLRILSQKKFRKAFVKLSTELRTFNKGFKTYFQKNTGWAVLSVGCTALFLLLLFSFSIVLVGAMGYHASPWTMLAFQVVVTFFMYFAPTPGATGVAEGGYGLLFAQLVQKQDIAPLVLSWRFMTIYIGVIIGMIITFAEFSRRNQRSANEE
ncbi:MAG: lysylphosphatidylglycerol synthase transmembrane domain-containing protein [Sphaerochaeta sp.]